MCNCSRRRGAGALTTFCVILLPLLALITGALGACGGDAGRAEIQFGVDADASAANVNVRQLQFYVHDVELIDEQGVAHPFRLSAAPPWQSEHVALVDLSGDAGAQRRAAILGTFDGGKPQSYTGIHFTVGVPFELNHGNPLTAAPPLDRGEMFWNWQSGHKFLRADLAADGREWSFHLGSTGCSSASALRPPAAPCAQPNEIRVELKGDPLRQTIRLLLEPLFAAAHATNYAICTGNYAHDPACGPAYATTGLNAQSGTCADENCTTQRLWTLE
jgi:uncharacterized repeat protein (TIGR04052 family)